MVCIRCNKNKKEINRQDILNLKQWASVRDSVGASVGDSVRASVGNSVGASVRDSVWAYTSTMFTLQQWKYIEHKKGQNPFAIVLKLWDKGLIPSFDGTNWRLHTGKKAKVIFTITKNELKKYK